MQILSNKCTLQVSYQHINISSHSLWEATSCCCPKPDSKDLGFTDCNQVWYTIRSPIDTWHCLVRYESLIGKDDHTHWLALSTGLFFEKGSGVYNSTRCRNCFSGNKSLWHLLCWLVEMFMLWITKTFWGMESNLPEITTAFLYSFPTTTTVSYIYNDFGRQAEPGKLRIFGGFNKCEAVALVYLLWNRINGRDSYSSCMDL